MRRLSLVFAGSTYFIAAISVPLLIFSNINYLFNHLFIYLFHLTLEDAKITRVPNKSSHKHTQVNATSSFLNKYPQAAIVAMHVLHSLVPCGNQWLGAYRTNALYSGHIFVRFNDLEDVFT